jgi:uncharacterized glyoxalase superfamily protein PhnB
MKSSKRNIPRVRDLTAKLLAVPFRKGVMDGECRVGGMDFRIADQSKSRPPTGAPAISLSMNFCIRGVAKPASATRL